MQEEAMRIHFVEHSCTSLDYFHAFVRSHSLPPCCIVEQGDVSRFMSAPDCKYTIVEYFQADLLVPASAQHDGSRGGIRERYPRSMMII